MEDLHASLQSWKNVQMFVTPAASLIIIFVITWLTNSKIEKIEKSIREQEKIEQVNQVNQIKADIESNARKQILISEENAKEQAIALDEIKAAIRKSGYEYDPTKGIISPNVQNVGPSGRAIQNNAPNYGNQHIGDVNINTPRTLTDKVKADTFNILSRLQSKEIIIVCLMGDSEALNFANEISEYAQSLGFKIRGGGVEQRAFKYKQKPLTWDDVNNAIIVGSKN